MTRMLTELKRFFSYAEQVAVFFLGLGTFFLALSPSLSRNSLVLAVIFSLLAGHWGDACYAIRRLKFIQWSLVLIVLMAISLSYSIASLKHGLTALFHYTKLLYIPFLLPLFTSLEVRRRIIYCLISSAIVASILFLLAHWNILSVSLFQYSSVLFGQQPAGYLVNPIPASVIVAFAFYFSLDFFLKEKAKFYFLLIAIFLFFSLFAINSERTGCFIAIILLIFLLFQHFIVKKNYILPLLIAVLVPILSYQIFPSFQYRVKDLITNFSTKPASQETSIGLRVQFALNSLKIVQKNPLLGVGAGGFPQAYRKIVGDRGVMFNDPHNSYSLIAVQLGIIGLVTYLLILGSAWFEIKKLWKDPQAQWFARATLFGLVFNGLTDITITSTAFGNLYVILLSSFFSVILWDKS
ncbi:O-antigen ligase family protein [Rickettsiella endosymbiont of Miltochrista miniata]|uniref:O-antigen ligase family protein n=1 Tax=Rickettsiella endosymbiont of Miltochrista miniata TaxID=3066239 RepID=UPI00313C9E60